MRLLYWILIAIVGILCFGAFLVGYTDYHGVSSTTYRTQEPTYVPIQTQAQPIAKDKVLGRWEYVSPINDRWIEYYFFENGKFTYGSDFTGQVISFEGLWTPIDSEAYGLDFENDGGHLDTTIIFQSNGKFYDNRYPSMIFTKLS